VKKFGVSFNVFGNALVEFGRNLRFTCHFIKAVALVDVTHEGCDYELFCDCLYNQNTTGSDTVSFVLLIDRNFKNYFGETEDFL
jgi:hypothetical protein